MVIVDRSCVYHITAQA